ncbi:MAG: Nif11-like leader peptide family natural product precursor [Deltaproteobacteria bacterium]|nr:Nif11-like leader peptide family natural product precursor [Deltaproteobacteria bacterium]
MDTKTIQTFFEAACSDETIQKELQAVEPGASAAERISAIARSRGFEFSATDLRAAMGKTGALSDAELGQVAGGIIIVGGAPTQGSLDVRGIKINAYVESALGAVR